MKKAIFILSTAIALTSCLTSKNFPPGNNVLIGYSKNDSVQIVFYSGNAAHFADRKARAARRAKAADSLAAVKQVSNNLHANQ